MVVSRLELCGRAVGIDLTVLDNERLVAKAKEMLDIYPRTFNVDAEVVARAIEALVECANTCTQLLSLWDGYLEVTHSRTTALEVPGEVER